MNAKVVKGLFVAALLLLPMVGRGQCELGFSVSEKGRVIFAQGNVQYDAGRGSWRFLDYMHLYNPTSKLCHTMFGWATSGYEGMKGDLDSPRNTDYGPATGDLDGTRYDWGVNNRMANGDIYTWRTLNKSEWDYLLFRRPDAGRLRGKATVNGTPGLVLLPDDWVQPQNVTFVTGERFDANVYSLVLWARMETAGAVFLPAVGYGWDGERVDWYSAGYYWTTTTHDDQTAYLLKFSDRGVALEPAPRRYGATLRLVSDCR